MITQRLRNSIQNDIDSNHIASNEIKKGLKTITKGSNLYQSLDYSLQLHVIQSCFLISILNKNKPNALKFYRNFLNLSSEMMILMSEKSEETVIEFSMTNGDRAIEKSENNQAYLEFCNEIQSTNCYFLKLIDMI